MRESRAEAPRLRPDRSGSRSCDRPRAGADPSPERGALRRFVCPPLRMRILGTGHASCGRGAGPPKVRANVVEPIVLPFKFIVMTRWPFTWASVHWLRAGPLRASSSRPSGSGKLSLKSPARAIDTSRSTAITIRSSSRDNTWRPVTRTSGATATTLKSSRPPDCP